MEVKLNIEFRGTLSELIEYLGSTLKEPDGVILNVTGGYHRPGEKRVPTKAELEQQVIDRVKHR